MGRFRTWLKKHKPFQHPKGKRHEVGSLGNVIGGFAKKIVHDISEKHKTRVKHVQAIEHELKRDAKGLIKKAGTGLVHFQHEAQDLDKHVNEAFHAGIDAAKDATVNAINEGKKATDAVEHALDRGVGVAKHAFGVGGFFSEASEFLPIALVGAGALGLYAVSQAPGAIDNLGQRYMEAEKRGFDMAFGTIDRGLDTYKRARQSGVPLP